MSFPKPKSGYKVVLGRFKKFLEIPEHWEWTTIGNECKLTGGSTPSREHSEFFNGKILWVNSGELDYNIIEDTKWHITKDAVKDANLQIHSPGTFLIAITGLEAAGTRGRCAILGKESTTNQSCMAFYPNKKILSKFLFYYWQYFGESLIFQLAQGTKQQSLNVKLVKSIKIALPSVDEQEKIVSFLSNISELIQKQQQVIKQTKKLMKGQMQKLLSVGIGHEKKLTTIHSRFKKIIKIPKEWEYKKLGDISDIKRGASPRPIADSKYFGSGRGWVRIADVSKSSKYLNKTKQQLSPLGESKSVEVNYGDVIMSIAATIGKPIIVQMKACIHDGFVVFTNLDKSMNATFLYYLLLKQENQFKSFGQHGTQTNLNIDLVSNAKFPKPPLPEQQKIASILSNLDLLIQQEKQYKEKLEKIKRGLMQQLLTGQKRVKL